MAVIKSLSVYDGSAWQTAIPFGMSASNITITSVTINGTTCTTLQAALTAIATIIGG